jgi:hypothetical protein
MDYWPGYVSKGDPLPRTLRFCKVCLKETLHEIRSGAGLTAKICVKCMEDERRYELDRDGGVLIGDALGLRIGRNAVSKMMNFAQEC